MIGDCGLTMQMIDGAIRPDIGYHIRKEFQRKGYASEAAAAVRDWTFRNTPFMTVYSYMNADNMPSVRTAIAWGGHLDREYIDTGNVRTLVYVMKREAWTTLNEEAD